MTEKSGARFSSEPAERPETEADRAARIAYERALVEEARDDVRAGRVIADEDVDRWLDRFASGGPLVLPDAPAPSRAE